MPTPKPIGLRQWIWRAFVRSALIPLVLVEAGLIAIYLLTNSAIRDAQIEHLRETALNDLQASASLESRLISEQLEQVASLTELYRNLTAQALLGDAPVAPPERAPLIVSAVTRSTARKDRRRRPWMTRTGGTCRCRSCRRFPRVRG